MNETRSKVVVRCALLGTNKRLTVKILRRIEGTCSFKLEPRRLSKSEFVMSRAFSRRVKSDMIEDDRLGEYRWELLVTKFKRFVRVGHFRNADILDYIINHENPLFKGLKDRRTIHSSDEFGHRCSLSESALLANV